MAKSVTSAFNEFLKNSVNLDSVKTKSAISSRNWLIEKIHDFPKNDSSFPILDSTKDINFGSFARKTKKRPLDDVDMMICLNCDGASYHESSNEIEITIKDNSQRLKALCDTSNNVLNSIKVVNKFVSNLKNIPQYKKSGINRRQEAAVLNLTSYDWSFDIVPCFFTKEDSFGRSYYLIPNGNGNWKKTDPRIDRDRISKINQQNNGNILNVIRIIKYWNKRPTMPSMSSYLIENMVINYYEKKFDTSEYVDIEIPSIFEYIKNNIYNSVFDPKGIQGDINTLTYEEQKKIYDRANLDYCKSINARDLEDNNQQKESINKWREVFGSEFPNYE